MGFILHKKILKIRFYYGVGIKVNILIFVLNCFNLKGHFFLLILKEIKIFLCASKLLGAQGTLPLCLVEKWAL